MKCVQDVLSAISPRVRISRFPPKSEFRGHHHALAVSPLLQEFTDERLAGSVGISVGSVNEVVTRIEKLIEDLASCVFGISPTPLGSKRHCSETKTRYAQATLTQEDVFIQHSSPRVFVDRLVGA